HTIFSRDWSSDVCSSDLRVRGLPNIPSITEINVRSGPSTSTQLVFKVPVGMSGQRILEVQTDSGGANLEGKVYEWLKLVFDGGRSEERRVGKAGGDMWGV